METIDFSKQTIEVTIEDKSGIFYASINPEIIKHENSFIPTNNYWVYMVHPKYGSINFRIKPDNNSGCLWSVLETTKDIDSEIIALLADAIENKNE